MKLLRYEIFECDETLNNEILNSEILEGKKSKYTDDIVKIKDKIKSLKIDKKNIINRHEYELSSINQRLAELKERKNRLQDWRKRSLE